MRAIVDTNVLVSGMIDTSSFPGRVVDLLRSGRVQIVVDDRILSEYEDVLGRPYFRTYFSLSEVENILEFLRRNAFRTVCQEIVSGLPDPGDAPFLEVALMETVSLVTGNKKHFPSALRRGCKVFTPREFIESLAEF